MIDIIRNQQTVVRKAYPEGPIDYIYTDENGQTHTLKKKTQGDDFLVGMSDSLLYYYSYQSDKLIRVGGSIRYPAEIHGLYEENDSVLWVVTFGSGLIKVDAR